jgi:hypothetical protein
MGPPEGVGCYHPDAGIVFVALPFRAQHSVHLDLLPTMYSFFLMANIQNDSPHCIIHSHHMTLSQQKIVSVFRLGTLPALPSCLRWCQGV